MKRSTGRPLRWHLLQIALVSLVPAALFTAAVIVVLWKTQEEERVRTQLQSVRAIASAVDNVVASAVRRANLLAVAPSALVELSQLEALARSVLAESDDLENVLLLDALGNQVFNAAAPRGPLPRSGDRPEQRLALEGDEIVLTDVFVGRTRGRPVIDIIAPLRAERYRGYLLHVSLKLAYFDRLIADQGLASGSIASVLDRNRRFIARSIDAEDKRGQLPTAAFLAALTEAPEGVRRLTTPEGAPVFSSWTRTKHGWTVGYGAPATPIETPLKQSLALLAASWAAVLAISILRGYELARAVRRRVGDALRLVAVSGYGLESDKQKALAAGCDAHFTKPLDFRGLYAFLAQRA